MRYLRFTASGRRGLLAGVAVSGALATLAALASVLHLGVLPPRIEARSLGAGGATVRVMAGEPRSLAPPHAVAALGEPDRLSHLSARSTLLANLLSSAPVRERIGRAIGVDPERIAASTPVTRSIPGTLIEPSFERRASQLRTAGDPYRLELQPDPDLPVIGVYAQAPTAAEATQLADAVAPAGNDFLRQTARQRGASGADRVQLVRLGTAVGGPLDPTAPIKVAGLTFLLVFALAGAVVLLLRHRHAAARPADVTTTPPATAAGGDWPRTTRVLPWLVAAFVAMLWLVPFNAIQIEASLPVDLKLDRLVLPLIVVAWALAAATGAGGAARRRFNPIHAALGAFAALACLSVVLNAGPLTDTLGLDLAIKKLTLLGAYLSLFVVVASVVRKREIPAFLTLILAVAAVCAVGTLWEYRFGYNVFSDLAAKALPAIFDVQPDPTGFDDLGRRAVSGPTDHGLELVALLTVALPIALVRLVEAPRLRRRLLYGLIACLLIAAAVSTYRKSAFLAPIAVVATIVLLRPVALRRLLPLGAVAILALPLLSFSAFGSVADQLRSDHLDVPTVGDRVSDYDAIRPDVLTHPLLGRGFGSYEHASDPASARILDSELLVRLVETGILGLLAYLGVLVTTIAVAVKRIRAPGGGAASSTALIVAAAAAAFLVLSALFDEWSFPHAPYAFLTLAGLLAVACAPEGGREATSSGAAPRRRAHPAGAAGARPEAPAVALARGRMRETSPRSRS